MLWEQIGSLLNDWRQKASRCKEKLQTLYKDVAESIMLELCYADNDFFGELISQHRKGFANRKVFFERFRCKGYRNCLHNLDEFLLKQLKDRRKNTKLV